MKEMNTEMNAILVPKNNSKYPILKHWNGTDNLSTDLVVLFIKPNAGIVIQIDKNNTEGNYVGEYCDCWDEDNFIPFNGTITLSNS